MAFQKILTLTLTTDTAVKMVEYVDLFIRSFNVDPTSMTNLQKENFIKAQFFKMLKVSIKNQSDKEKLAAIVSEDVETIITGV